MRIHATILYLLIALFPGCYEKENIGSETSSESGETTYIIKRGSHSVAGNHFKVISTDAIRCEVIFDSSAVYQTVNTENQEDVNKLIGFSDCNGDHHQNSARLGWAWNGHAITMYAYAYVNGERVIKSLGVFQLNHPVSCSVTATGDKYYFAAGAHTDSVSRHCIGYSGTRYKLFPYFGGDEVAPHDIRIRIRNF